MTGHLFLEAQPNFPQTSKVESFETISKSLKLSILDVCEGPGHASGFYVAQITSRVFEYVTEVYLEPCRISTMEIFCANDQRCLAMEIIQKIHNIQCALLRMIKNWKRQINNKNNLGVVIMDTNALDNLISKLLIEKLEKFWSRLRILKIFAYLSNQTIPTLKNKRHL